MTQRLPNSANVAAPLAGEKLHAPSAARNADALCRLLKEHAPQTGMALEIASGTGQHVVAFARALPGLLWQPTEVDARRLSSISAYRDEAALENVLAPRHLDATRTGWHRGLQPQDLIVLINLLHLISEPQAQVVIAEAVAALRPGGRLLVYGPFRRHGVLTSEGDERFDAQLRGADASIGYKNDCDIAAWLRSAGCAKVLQVEMPANNLAFIARR